MPIDRRSRTLCCVGFVFKLAGRGDERHERQVDVERVLAADVPDGTDGWLHERQALDVADRAPDLDQQDVHVLRRRSDAVFDLVGDVRDHLHRPAEVLAAAFLLNH
jgi:hypothetical protein